MTVQTQTYDVALARLPELEKLLAKMTRKCARLGKKGIQLDPPEIVSTTPFDLIQVYTPANGGGWDHLGTYEDEIPEGTDLRKCRVDSVAMERIELRGVMPVVSGWEFVATLQHTPEGTVARVSPAFGGQVPERFRTASPDHCDHCGKRRKRNDTFVIRSTSLATFAQVGRNCLRDFLADGDPAAWLAQYAFEKDLATFFGGGGFGHGSFSTALPTLSFIAACAHFILRDGFVSRKLMERALDNGWTRIVRKGTTSSNARHALLTTDGEALEEFYGQLSAREWEIAEGALQWMRSGGIDPHSDYGHAVRTFASAVVLRDRAGGYLAAATNSYIRDVLRIERDEGPQGLNEHVPGLSPGDKATLTLTVQAVGQPCGFFSARKVAFTDPEGRLVVWWASPRWPAVDPGELVTVVGWVKDLGEWNGRRETTLTRVKVVPAQEAA